MHPHINMNICIYTVYIQSPPHSSQKCIIFIWHIQQGNWLANNQSQLRIILLCVPTLRYYISTFKALTLM